MIFASLALIAMLAIAGPAPASCSSLRLPVIVGELLAGIAFGATGFRILHAGPGEPAATILGAFVTITAAVAIRSFRSYSASAWRLIQ
ncbi:MAG: hypothetical protein HOQ24_18450 [Mycobacteriaceae bacterium]|nr:hypothetical protein [Mycobacteriaceae bacterium]